MARQEHRIARDTHHTVFAGVLEAFGKGFLIATAGVVAGLMFGTAPMASMALWTVGVAAVSGVACMVGSTLVRNAGYDHCEMTGDEWPANAQAKEIMAAMPGVEAAEAIASDDRWARRMVMLDRQREHGKCTGRGI